MVVSINNNPAAVAGVFKIDQSSSVLDRIRERAATGKKVNSPRDDAAVFAVAKQLEGLLSGATAVKGTLAFGEAATGVAISASAEVSDLLIQAKAKALQASQEGLDPASRQALQAKFTQITEQIQTVVKTAEFNGVNLIDGGASDLNVVSGEGSETISVAANDLSTAGLGIDSLSLGSAADARSALASISSALASTSIVSAGFGASASRLDNQSEFNTTLSNSISQGIGNLVDGDLSVESAKLLASEVKQRLGLQSLSIANSAPSSISALFQ